MSSPLQKAPDGLLGALDLKTLGRSPSQFPDALQAVFEAQEFYLLGLRRITSIGGAFAAIGATIGGITVPQNEVWRVNAIAIAVTRAAADAALNIEVQVALRRASTTGSLAIFSNVLPAVAATDLLQGRGIVLPEQLWMGPGDLLRLTCNTTITVAGSNLNVIIDYNPMQA
ncbi:MAG TPA: hypothetical protein VJ924_10375 [Alphaproteobacteria bacterium]|nr:hypothetical protein [Alphaproteobacteria bacterium]